MHPDIRLIELTSGDRPLEPTSVSDRKVPIYIGLIDGQMCVRSPDRADATLRLLQLAGMDTESQSLVRDML
jgi:hypothetical protein